MTQAMFSVGIGLMFATFLIGVGFFVCELWKDGYRGGALFVGGSLLGAVIALGSLAAEIVAHAIA